MKAQDMAAALRGRYAGLVPGSPRRRPDVEAALDAAKARLGVTVPPQRRDGTPVEQTRLDVS